MGRKILVYKTLYIGYSFDSNCINIQDRLSSYIELIILVIISAGGALSVLILKRTARFDANPKDPLQALSFHKLNIPKKTKLFVDQTMRERENAVRKFTYIQ